MAQPLKHLFFFNSIVGGQEEGKTNYTDCAAPLLEGGCGSFVCLLSMTGYYVAQ